MASLGKKPIKDVMLNDIAIQYAKDDVKSFNTKAKKAQEKKAKLKALDEDGKKQLLDYIFNGANHNPLDDKKEEK